MICIGIISKRYFRQQSMGFLLKYFQLIITMKLINKTSLLLFFKNAYLSEIQVNVFDSSKCVRFDCPANIYLFNVNNTYTRRTIDVVLVSLLLTLNIFTPFSSVFIVEFEQANIYWALVQMQ